MKKMKKKKLIAAMLTLMLLLATAQNAFASITLDAGPASVMYAANTYQVPLYVKAGKTIRAYMTKGKRAKFIAPIYRGTKWKISNKKILSVNKKSGLIKAKAKGTATIRMTYGKRTYACKITVETPSISKKAITIKQGQTYQLKMKGTKQKFSWYSTGAKASVSAKGKVKGLYVGVTYIKARTTQGEEYKCKVTVKSCINPKAPGGVYNPLPGRSETEFAIKQYNGTKKYRLKLLEVVDGARANALVNEENRYNAKPSANERWVLYHINLRYIAGSGQMSGSDAISRYDLFNEKGTLGMNTCETATLGKNLKPPYSYMLYPGGQCDFWYGILLPKNVKYTTLRTELGWDDYGNRLEKWIRLN